MRIILTTLITLFWAGLAGCATADVQQPEVCLDLPDGGYCAYDEGRNAAEDIRIAQKIAADDDLKTIIVMGANWCHDSRALAGHFRRDRFTPLLARHYRLVYVDVGYKNRNLDIARSFGLDGIKGTPSVIITDSDGTVLNLDTAPTWRNAASRSEDEIYEYFESFATQE